MKKKILTSFFAAGLLIASSANVFAAPYNSAEKNPQTVAFYENGTHGIPSETGGNHEGTNMVKQNGNSGNFQAWFYGTFPAGSEGLHGHHSVWKISKGGTCPPNSTLVTNASEGWGDYLVEGEDYCVMENKYKTEK